MSILDTENNCSIRIKGDRTRMIAADELDSNGCAFNVGINVECKVVTFLLRRIAAEASIAGYVFKCADDSVTSNRDA